MCDIKKTSDSNTEFNKINQGDNKMKTIYLNKDLFPEACFNMDEYTSKLKYTRLAKIKRWLSVRVAEIGIF